MAPLLASVEPDLVVCMGFPWKIPADALAVPKHGWLNGHPSLLPLHRGPTPVAWAIRAGDDELGISFHRMDAELDTGPILVQRRIPFGELEPPDDFFPKIGPDRRRGACRGAREARGRRAGDGAGRRLRLVRDVLRRRRRVARPGAAGRGGAPARVGLALRDARRRRAEGRRSSSSTARRCACSPRRSPRSEGATRVECGDGPLWIVETEELSEAEASASSAPAPSTP